MAEHSEHEVPLTKHGHDRSEGEEVNAKREQLDGPTRPTGAGREANPYDQLPRTPDRDDGEVF
jgi:hypothetical protein